MEKNLTTGSVLKTIIYFALPYLLSYFLQTLYGMADLYITGQFNGVDSITAVSNGSQVMHMLTVIIVGLAMGTTVIIGKAIGGNKLDNAGRAIGNTITLFMGIAIVMTIVFLIAAKPIVLLIGVPQEAVAGTVRYLIICFIGIPFITAYNIISSIFRGLGDSKSPLIFVAVACVVNIAGDLILVAGLHLDAAGAAIATVFAQAVSVVFALLLLFKRNLPFTIKKSDFRINEHCNRALKIGLPLALQECLTQISFLALCAFINRLGLEASSGYGVACKIVNFAMLIPSSLMQSTASFISQNVGAGNEKRAKKTLFTGIGVGLTIGCIVFIFIMFKGDILTGIFTTDEIVIQKGYDYLRGFALETILTAVLFSMIGYFNGHDKTVWVMIQGLIQTLLVRLPLAYYMSIQPDASLTKIGFAAPAATMFGIVLNVIFYIYCNRKTKNN